MSYRVGGKRTKLGRAATKGDHDRAPGPGPPALKILATREDLDQVKAGAAVPVKLSLGGDFGLDILAAGSPASQGIACNASATVEDIEETVTAGASSLGYDPQSGRYSYVWKTRKGWAGTCRQLLVTLDEEHKGVRAEWHLLKLLRMTMFSNLFFGDSPHGLE